MPLSPIKGFHMMSPHSTTELKTIRHHLHKYPELGYEEHNTADFIADFLKDCGLTIARNIGQTGIVATLERGDCSKESKTLGLRTDMDALPITEINTTDYASCNTGKMHACGHDGHMTIMLGTIRELSQDQNFVGRIHFIFQPAEEGLGGAKAMIEDGLFERFPCDMVFALHNIPGIPLGHFTTRTGPLMASVDFPTFTVHGEGGHGAVPEQTVDPILVGAHIVTALQSVVSRNLPPKEQGVVTVGSFHSGTVSNIIPETAQLQLSLRATSTKSRELLIERVTTIAQSTAAAFGARAEVEMGAGYPVLVNSENAVKLVEDSISQSIGADCFSHADCPLLISEDFSFMIQDRPGAMVFMGNGDSAALHNPSYDFNDAGIEHGVTFFTKLAKSFFA